MVLPNKLNMYSKWVYFLFMGYLYLFWLYFFVLNLIKCEFHTRLSIVIYPYLYIVCLATTWNLRFCALTPVGALFAF